jgi:hypothetical protein
MTFRRLAVACLPVALVVAAAGCGSDTPSNSPADAPATSSPHDMSKMPTGQTMPGQHDMSKMQPNDTMPKSPTGY